MCEDAKTMHDEVVNSLVNVRLERAASRGVLYDDEQ